jgi:hypothetical protein
MDRFLNGGMGLVALLLAFIVCAAVLCCDTHSQLLEGARWEGWYEVHQGLDQSIFEQAAD